MFLRKDRGFRPIFSHAVGFQKSADLSPTEWVWSYLKLIDLANVACDTLAELGMLILKIEMRQSYQPLWLPCAENKTGIWQAVDLPDAH